METEHASESSAGKSRWPLRLVLMAAQLLTLGLAIAGFATAMSVAVWRWTFDQAESDLLGAAQLLMEQRQQGVPADALRIDPVYQHKLGKAPRDHAYVVVWNQAGEQIGVLGEVPADLARPLRVPPADHPHPFWSQAVDGRLDLAIQGPQQETLLIGRPLAKENDRLRRWMMVIGLTSSVCLGAGVLVAAAISSIISRSVGRLTFAAENISATELATRVDTSSRISELQRLGEALNRMLMRLQNAFDRQVRFTADASHELRTPVTIILSQAEQTLARPRSEESYRSALDTCASAARVMRRLVEDLLTLARADSGQLSLRISSVELDEIAAESVQLLTSLAATRQLMLRTELHPVTIPGDASRLLQAVMNLIVNAIQYSHEGKEIFVRVEMQGDEGILTVSDRGVGIDPMDQAKIFERFFQVDASRTSIDHRGSGLGLSIVSEIVDAHHGRIELHSQPGAGTQVSIRLPKNSPATSRDSK